MRETMELETMGLNTIQFNKKFMVTTALPLPTESTLSNRVKE